MKHPYKIYRFTRIGISLLFLACAGMAFSGFSRIADVLLKMQFGPALMKCFAAFSAGALACVLSIALITILFGRFYCSFFCPFGILQDFFGWISRRKAKTVPDFRKTRYVIGGISFGMLIAGWTVPFLFLDPYSNFGRIVGAFTAGGFLPLLAIAPLASCKNRIYCTTVCPVGMLLGLLAKHSLFRLHIAEENCVKCGICAGFCPSGCIDSSKGTLDNERCVRCMNCLAECRTHAIHFSMPNFREKAENAKNTEKASLPVDQSRRAFLINGTVLLAGLSAAIVLAKTGMNK